MNSTMWEASHDREAIASSPPVEPLVDPWMTLIESPGGDPFDVLLGYLGDAVVVGVVMQHGGPVELSGRGDDQAR